MAKPTIGKFKHAFLALGRPFDGERETVKRVAALIKVRNELVHPKVLVDAIDIEIERKEGKWLLSTSLELDSSELLPIIVGHKTMGWRSIDSLLVLNAVNDFFSYLLDEVLASDIGFISTMFCSFIEGENGLRAHHSEEYPDDRKANLSGIDLSAFERFRRIVE